MADWSCLNSWKPRKPFTGKTPNKIGSFHAVSKENETDLKYDKITAYQVFGWVPLSIFFIEAGTTALIGLLNTLKEVTSVFRAKR